MRAGSVAARVDEFLRSPAVREPRTRTALPMLHPFAAPMSPTLATNLISFATGKTDFVFDPMAGSGTVALSAASLGRAVRACDIDPLARLIIRVASSDIDPDRFLKAGEDVLSDATSRLKQHKGALLSELSRSIDDETAEFIEFWFPRQSRLGLAALKLAIAGRPRFREALLLTLSRTIISKGASVSWAIDVPHSRPHRALSRTVPDPLHSFQQQLRTMTRLLRTRPLATGALHVGKADARRTFLRAASVDLVLTSSPYINAIDYMRAHKFSLVWMGYSLDEIREIRSRMLGAERRTDQFRSRLAWLDRALLHRDAPRLRSIQRKFFYDLEDVLEEMMRVLRPGGACVLVLGETSSGGRTLNTPRITRLIAEGAGFIHLGTRFRSINPLRRSLPFTSQGGALGSRMRREAIIGLGVPG